ncbi:TniQ family protein [Paraburkholderia youngii]|uniref:TniQ family protein n=1 Tax=Paraburkholderia youngii TaxID=2782701 RepID=A0A7Y6JWC9_9BURK|nr:TniQ family protein [Paraburkholderia youngii]NUX99533.1 TniQ family protein [Paraburkholderia youngii]
MLYFPSPYPDELLGGLLIRACHHLGLSPTALVHLLGDGSGDLSFVYPSFFNGISRLTRVPTQELLINHTVFPYAAIGLSTQKRSILARDLLSASARGNSVRLRSTLGLHIEALSCRRYCEQCCHEDRDRNGESYWHTQHMLPGVFVCPHHGKTLHISGISVLPKLSAGNAKLPQEVTGQPGNWGLDEQSMRRLARAVLDTTDLPAHTWDTASLEYCAIVSSIAATHEHRHWHVDPMVAQFGRFYGLEFLQRIGLGLTSLDTDAWPATLLRGAHPYLLLQLRHILLRLFLQTAWRPKDQTPHKP